MGAITGEGTAGTPGLTGSYSTDDPNRPPKATFSGFTTGT
jgi:hypothetical protein